MTKKAAAGALNCGEETPSGADGGGGGVGKACLVLQVSIVAISDRVAGERLALLLGEGSVPAGCHGDVRLPRGRWAAANDCSKVGLAGSAEVSLYGGGGRGRRGRGSRKLRLVWR